MSVARAATASALSSTTSSALDKYCRKLPTRSDDGNEGDFEGDDDADADDDGDGGDDGDAAVVSWPSYQNGRKTLLLPL